MHHATHAKPNVLRRTKMMCCTLAKRYVKAHRKWHLVAVCVIFLIELWVLILVHEFAIHLTVAGATWGWDAFIILLGEVDGE
jgi:uncharacterized integral membrane protein